MQVWGDQNTYHISIPGSYHLLRVVEACFACISCAMSVFLRDGLLIATSLATTSIGADE